MTKNDEQQIATPEAEKEYPDDLLDLDVRFGDQFDVESGGEEPPSDDEVKAGAEEQEDETPEGEEEVAEEEVEPKKEEEAPPQTAAPAPTQQQAPPQQEASPAAESAAPAAPQDFAQMVSQNADQLVKHLADGPFKLQGDDAEMFDPDVAKWIASRDARNYLNAVTDMHRMVQTMVPPMVAQIVQQQSTYRSYEENFYGKYPELKGHSDKVLGLAQGLRQANPSMAEAEFEQMLVNTARAVFQVQAAQAKPKAPKTRVVSKKAFAPGNPSGGAPSSGGGSQEEANPLWDLNEALKE